MSKEFTEFDIGMLQSQAKQLRDALTDVPEVREACKWMTENPDDYELLVTDYLMLMTVFDNLTDEDVKRIAQAESELLRRRVSRDSASNITVIDFINKVRGNVSLQPLAFEGFSASSEYFNDATNVLAEMMLNGHKLFAKGGVPRDGDPESDKVIWGHTQARKDVAPEVIANFVVSHFMARYFTLALAEFDILREKDDFFAPLTTMLMIHESRNPGITPITKAWMTAREDGGLNWLSQEKLDVYKEYFGTNSHTTS